MSYPAWLPEKYQEAWDKPWDDAVNKSGSNKYKALLTEHGYITPHFTWAEASGKGRNRYGTDVPKHLMANARRQAWRLEKLRHRLGDIALVILSWYRNDRHNRDVGGASLSRHRLADATDFDMNATKVSRADFDREADKLYADGGFGQYPSGARHTDTRGERARWTSY